MFQYSIFEGRRKENQCPKQVKNIYKSLMNNDTIKNVKKMDKGKKQDQFKKKYKMLTVFPFTNDQRQLYQLDHADNEYHSAIKHIAQRMF